MKTLRFIALIVLFINGSSLLSQAEWQPVLINYDGTNENEGVIGNYQLSTCNNADVVIFKLENTTTKKFKAQWYHLLQDKDGKDFKGAANLQTLILEPGKTQTGSCKDKVLMIKLGDFGITKEQFGTFIALAFNIQEVK